MKEKQVEQASLDLQKVWDLYENQLRLYLGKRLKKQSEIGDLLHDILLKAHQNFHTLRSSSSFRSWLYQIAHYTLMDHFRMAKKELPLPEKWEVATEDESKKDTSQLSACVLPFLQHLPEKYRQVLEEVELKGTPQKELAKKMGLSYSGVKTRVQRGRQMLVEAFISCCQVQVDARGGIIDFVPQNKCCDEP